VRQFLQLTQSIQSSSLGVCMWFSQHSQHSVSESSHVSWLRIYVLIACSFCIFWPFRLKVLGMFILSISLLSDFIPSLLSRFSSIMLSSSLRKKRVAFLNWISSRYFLYWTDLNQKSGGINYFRGSVRRKHGTQSSW